MRLACQGAIAPNPESALFIGDDRPGDDVDRLVLHQAGDGDRLQVLGQEALRSQLIIQNQRQADDPVPREDCKALFSEECEEHGPDSGEAPEPTRLLHLFYLVPQP